MKFQRPLANHEVRNAVAKRVGQIRSLEHREMRGRGKLLNKASNRINRNQDKNKYSSNLDNSNQVSSNLIRSSRWSSSLVNQGIQGSNNRVNSRGRPKSNKVSKLVSRGSSAHKKEVNLVSRLDNKVSKVNKVSRANKASRVNNRGGLV